jgi:hypothetical protein
MLRDRRSAAHGPGARASLGEGAGGGRREAAAAVRGGVEREWGGWGGARARARAPVAARQASQETRKLEADMRMVLHTLERYHGGTHLSWKGGPVNPEHPCRFSNNPLGEAGNPYRELSFTCQVQNDKMVATVPLESPFVRHLFQGSPRDLQTYREDREIRIDPGETHRRQPTIKSLSPDGERIYMNLTYEITNTQNTTKRSCLFMAYNAKEFSELLDCLLGTQTQVAWEESESESAGGVGERERRWRG